jgi:membrane protein
MHLSQIRNLINKSVTAWMDDYAQSMGAALAYYTLFSIAPFLIIVIALAGLVFGQDAARGEIAVKIQTLIGLEGGIAVQALLKSAANPARNVAAMLVSVITLVIGATTVFSELQSDLDRIWRVPVPAGENGIWALLRSRLLSFGLVLGLGLLLLVSLVISAALAAVGTWWEEFFRGWKTVLYAVDFCISLAISTVLFAMIFKLMPRTRIAWRDVWIGALATALLIGSGKYLIGMYLGIAGITSTFGAAASLVILLMWVYFAAQIFLLGAEFTRVYSYEYGSNSTPTDLVEVPVVPHCVHADHEN